VNPPKKLLEHGQHCLPCHNSDGFTDMCRIGRRLYLGWFRNLDNDGKMFALIGMPEAMRNEVLKHADLEGEVSFGDVNTSLPPPKSS